MDRAAPPPTPRPSPLSGRGVDRREETLREAVRRCTRLLGKAGIGEPEADARVLVEAAAGVSGWVRRRDADAILDSAAAARLDGLLVRRLAREPVFRIVGRRAFWNLELEVTPAVLDPRPDTETIVTAALEALGARRDAPLRLLDLGVGSGAILLALLSELPRATGVGIDLSGAACEVARRNAQACGLADRAVMLEGDFAAHPGESFDLVVSNPPYVETAAVAELDPEVRDHDPLLALDGGPDGLDAYRAICTGLRDRLGPGGIAVLEVGAGQAAAVAALLREAGLHVAGTRRDLGGHERAVISRRPADSHGD